MVVIVVLNLLASAGIGALLFVDRRNRLAHQSKSEQALAHIALHVTAIAEHLGIDG